MQIPESIRQNDGSNETAEKLANEHGVSFRLQLQALVQIAELFMFFYALYKMYAPMPIKPMPAM